MLPLIPARISLVFVALMFFVPFLNPYHFHPMTNFYTEWIALALGLVALLPLSVKRFWEEVEIPGLTLWLLAFAALLPLQIVLLDIAYPELSLIGALNVIWAAWLVWLGRVLVRSCGMRQVAEWLAAALVFGGLINANAAVLQFYAIPSLLDPLVAHLPGGQGAWGNFAQNNHFADYLTLALVSTVYLRLRHRLSWLLTAACAGTFLYVLILSASRSTWIYLPVLLALSVWFRTRAQEPGLRRVALLVAVLLVLFGLLQYAMGHAGLATPRPAFAGAAAPAPLTPADRILAELATGMFPDIGGSALGTRLYMWHQAWLMLVKSPFFGIGFGQYAGVFFEQSAQFARYQIPHYDRNAHNALAQLLAETGLFGAALVCAGVAGWLTGLRERFSATVEMWWVLCLLLVLFVHSMIEYPLWHANFLGIAAVLAGMSSERCLRLHLTALSRFAFPLMLMVGFFALGSALQSYRDLEVRLYPPHLPTAQAAIIERNEALMRLHRDTLLAPYVEMTYAANIVVDKTNLDSKLALNGRVLRFLPVPQTAYLQVLLLGLNGELSEASAALDRAVKVFPEKLREFLPILDRAMPLRPEIYGEIARQAQEKLKQVDRNTR